MRWCFFLLSIVMFSCASSNIRTHKYRKKQKAKTFNLFLIALEIIVGVIDLIYFVIV